MIENKLEIINEDCFNPKLITTLNYYHNNKVNLYFYDGNHEQESQYKALVDYYDMLDNKFILVVDDWNNGNAAKGTKRAIKDLNLQILSEYILPANYNGDVWRWWDGLGVFILEK